MSDTQLEKALAALITIAILILTGILAALDSQNIEILKMTVVAAIFYWLPSPGSRSKP